MLTSCWNIEIAYIERSNILLFLVMVTFCSGLIY